MYAQKWEGALLYTKKANKKVLREVALFESVPPLHGATNFLYLFTSLDSYPSPYHCYASIPRQCLLIISQIFFNLINYIYIYIHIQDFDLGLKFTNNGSEHSYIRKQLKISLVTKKVEKKE